MTDTNTENNKKKNREKASILLSYLLKEHVETIDDDLKFLVFLKFIQRNINQIIKDPIGSFDKYKKEIQFFQYIKDQLCENKDTDLLNLLLSDNTLTPLLALLNNTNDDEKDTDLLNLLLSDNTLTPLLALLNNTNDDEKDTDLLNLLLSDNTLTPLLALLNNTNDDEKDTDLLNLLLSDNTLTPLLALLNDDENGKKVVPVVVAPVPRPDKPKGINRDLEIDESYVSQKEKDILYGKSNDEKAKTSQIDTTIVGFHETPSTDIETNIMIDNKEDETKEKKQEFDTNEKAFDFIVDRTSINNKNKDVKIQKHGIQFKQEDAFYKGDINYQKKITKKEKGEEPWYEPYTTHKTYIENKNKK
jgi:hypothetical protein